MDRKELFRSLKRTVFGLVSQNSAFDKPPVTDVAPPDSRSKSDTDDSMPGRIDSKMALDPPGRRDARRVDQPDLPVPERSKPFTTNADTGERGRSAGAAGASEDRPESTRSTTIPPPAFRPSAYAGRHLSVPDWSDTGRSLQHPEGTGRVGITVRMGIDFGTAFTKIAIRVGADLVVVDWSAVTGDDSLHGRHVLPGLVYRTRRGVYRWEMEDGAEILRNLKLPVIEGAGGGRCPCATLAFLALAIRHARAFLYRDPEVGRKLASRSLRWELNIGCPTEPHEKPEVVEFLRRVARTAWVLAGEGDLEKAKIEAAWNDQRRDTGLEEEPEVIPEFVAQIAGYLRSPQVNNGLHALIDIGAATLDVATFNVFLTRNGDGVPRIPIFFSAVRHLGTHYLSRRRHERLGLALVWDDAMPIEPAESFGRRHGRTSVEVERIDTDFAKQTAQVITTVIDNTRTNARGNPMSSAWREGLPVFVTGGGAGCSIYRRAIACAEQNIKHKIKGDWKYKSFRFIELDPLGSSRSAHGSRLGARTTVAIGLTEDAKSIARVVPHRDIEPISNPVGPRVDHTELYGDK